MSTRFRKKIPVTQCILEYWDQLPVNLCLINSYKYVTLLFSFDCSSEYLIIGEIQKWVVYPFYYDSRCNILHQQFRFHQLYLCRLPKLTSILKGDEHA